MTKLKYKVLLPVFSRQHNQSFLPGEVIEFRSNPENPKPGDIVVDFDLLVRMNVIAPVEGKDEPVKSGEGE